MKPWVPAGVLVFGICCAASAAPAVGPAPQYSAQDLEKSLAVPADAAPPAPPAGECEKKGMVTGDDGVCEPVKNERGFSLPTRSSLASKPAAAPRAAVGAQASIAPRHEAAARPSPHRDLLITFKTGSAELTPQAEANAAVFAQALSSPALSSGKFEIAGYTDAVGSPEKNLGLSQERADAVKSFLIAHGVDRSRIVATGYGATDFADPAHPTAGENRRVEARRVD